MTYLSSRLESIRVEVASEFAFLQKIHRDPIEPFAPVTIDDAVRISNWYEDIRKSFIDGNPPETGLEDANEKFAEDLETLKEVAAELTVERVLFEKFSQAIAPCRARHGYDSNWDYALLSIEGMPFSEVFSRAKKSYEAVESASKDDFPPMNEAGRLIAELEVIDLLWHD